jgi:hypothetical protein
MNSWVKNFGKKFLAAVNLFVQTGLSLALIIIFSKLGNKRPLKKDPKSGCIILGNGPSLSSQFEDVRQKRAENDLMCVNEFPLSSLFDELKPDYYTLLDPFYWFKTDGSIPALTQQIISTLRTKVTWNITLLLPFEMKSIIETLVMSNETKGSIFVYYFNRTPVSGFKWFKFKMYDWGWGIPFAHNVMVSSIYLGMLMRYKKIIVFGADHSWHEQIVVTKDNVLRVREDHFKYEKDGKSISPREEMYDPIYKFSYSKTGEREIFKIHELFDAYAKVFKGYWVLKEYAQHVGANVYNLSKKSYIDAFDRSA